MDGPTVLKSITKIMMAMECGLDGNSTSTSTHMIQPMHTSIPTVMAT
jgi:hypothetical protein